MRTSSHLKLALVLMMAPLTAGCPLSTTTYYLPMSGASATMPVAQAEAICKNERAQNASEVADTQETQRALNYPKNMNINAQRVHSANNNFARSMVNLASQFQSIEGCMARFGFAKHEKPNY